VPRVPGMTPDLGPRCLHGGADISVVKGAFVVSDLAAACHAGAAARSAPAPC
jgi:hypothetical protein